MKLIALLQREGFTQVLPGSSTWVKHFEDRVMLVNADNGAIHRLPVVRWEEIRASV